MFAQLVERGGVKNVRARVWAIEREQTYAIVADFALNHRPGHGGRHGSYLHCFSAKFQARRESGERTRPRVLAIAPSRSRTLLDRPESHFGEGAEMCTRGRVR